MTEWRPVFGWEDRYEVSDEGDVRSLVNNAGNLRDEPYVLSKNAVKMEDGGSGYYHVGFSRNGKPKTRKVHQLVMESFVGPCPEGHVVDHIDGNGKNNNVSNLRYVTPHENVRSGRSSMRRAEGVDRSLVSWSSSLGRWRVRVRYFMVEYCLVTTVNKEIADEYARRVKDLFGASEIEFTEGLDRIRKELRVKFGFESPHKYVGVTPAHGKYDVGKYVAKVSRRIEGKKISFHVGVYESEEDAKLVRDFFISEEYTATYDKWKAMKLLTRLKLARDSLVDNKKSPKATL